MVKGKSFGIGRGRYFLPFIFAATLLRCKVSTIK